MDAESDLTPVCTIHEAQRIHDGSGVVAAGRIIDEATAIQIRQQNGDVVVCGKDEKANRQQALTIEAAIGPWLRQNKHTNSAGPQALSHFQQKAPPPDGHTFYETTGAKARKQP
jgi:hypothetical protein